MSHLILALSTALATPPLPVPPAPLSAPMAAVDVGGATVVFPYGARKRPRMSPAEMEMVRRARAARGPQIDPKIAEQALIQASQSESWSGGDPSRAASYTVIVGPRPAQAERPACHRPSRSGDTCQPAHAGAAQGELVRRELPGGAVRETLTLYTPARSYMVSYDRFGLAAQARAGGEPADAAAGERFIRSFRLAGQPVVIGSLSH